MNWEQLKTILWLRSRLTRNQWARSKGIGPAVAAIIAVSAVVTGVGAFVGGLVGGAVGLRDSSSTVVWGVWIVVTVAFLFFWMIGLLQEIQRSESIDLQRLLHLPVALGQMFFVNYIASHFTVSLVVAVPAMLGLALGLTISRGPAMLLLIPLSLAMVGMISAWTYCLRGWLATLMSNPRRRRSITMGIVFIFVLIAQAPNLYFNVFHRFDNGSSRTGKASVDIQTKKFQDMADEFRAAQKYVPPLWLPWGAQGLAENNALPALIGILGCFGLGALGLRRAYNGTMRFYRGDPSTKDLVRVALAQTLKPAPIFVSSAASSRPTFLELRLPGVPEQAAALAFTTFRSLLRAPEVKLAWGTSFIVPFLVGGSLLLRGSAIKVPEAAQPFLVTGAAIFSVFMLVRFYANQFGFDREGFRALVLAPVERRFILLGKNLACLPVGIIFGLLLLLVLALRLHLSPLLLAAGFWQLLAALVLANIGGNLLSILVPYRIPQGSLRPSKMPPLATVVLMFSHLLFPIIMAPAFLPALAQLLWRAAGWSDVVPVNLLVSIGLAAVALLVYWLTLAPLGRLLHRRETRILNIVTAEVE